MAWYGISRVCYVLVCPAFFSSSDTFLLLRTQKSSTKKSSLFSEVIYLIKIILVIPISNAASEGSFSTLKRVKASILSAMTVSRLNHLFMIHIFNTTVTKKMQDISSNLFVHSQKFSNFVFRLSSAFGNFSFLSCSSFLTSVRCPKKEFVKHLYQCKTRFEINS